MGCYAGKCHFAPLLGRHEFTVILLIPFDNASHKAMAFQGIRHIIRHDPQIFAHNCTVHPAGFKRQDAQHNRGIILHVCAFIRCVPLRDPPQAEKPKDMVYADGTGFGKHPRNHIAVCGVAGLLKMHRIEWRLAPVLSLLVEHIRRRTDSSAPGKTLRVPPYFSPLGMHTYSHVTHNADLHPGPVRCLLGFCQLLRSYPFQPHVEFKRICIFFAQFPDLRGIFAVFFLPAAGVILDSAPLVVGQAPYCICPEVLAFIGAVLRELFLAGPGTRRFKYFP